MAITCPKCGRPNSEQAKKCIYCGAEINPPSPEEKPKPAPSKKEKKERKKERLYLIISPLAKEPSKDMVRGFAKIFGWDDYSAKLRLRSKIPWIACGFDDAKRAQELARKIKEIGIDTYIIKSSGLKKLEKKELAKRAFLKEDGIDFELFSGRRKFFKFKEIFLLVKGKINFDEDVLKIALAGFNEQITKVSGSAFERYLKRRRQKKLEKAKAPIPQPLAKDFLIVFDLYSKSDFTGIRILESEFDFTEMFGREIQSQAIRMERFIKLLKEKSPNLIIDDNFTRQEYYFKEKPTTEALGIATFFGQSQANYLHSSYATFSNYSSRIFLHYLREARKD